MQKRCMADSSGHHHLKLLYMPLYSVSPQLKELLVISSSVSRCLALIQPQSQMRLIYSASQSHQARNCLNIVLCLLFKVTALYVMTARLTASSN